MRQGICEIRSENISLCREVRIGGGGDRGTPLTCTYAGSPVSRRSLPLNRVAYLCMHTLLGACARVYHLMVVGGSTSRGFGVVRRLPLPLRWLHHRQITAVLLSVSVPPLL